MRATSTWRGGYESLLEDGRGHVVTIDLPVGEGGGDRGTSGIELAVLSLAGCITTIFALIAERRGLPFDAMRVELEAERPRGSRTVTAVQGTFSITTRASPDEVETVLRLTIRTCPVGVIFDRAQIPIRVRCVVTAPSGPAPSMEPTTAAVHA